MRERLEDQALEDYERARGRIVEVPYLSGYSGDMSVDVRGPFLVWVDKTTENEILHWNDEWLDPYWNVRPVQPYEELKGLRSLWAFGKSYSLEGKQDTHAPRVLAVRESLKVLVMSWLRNL